MSNRIAKQVATRRQRRERGIDIRTADIKVGTRVLRVEGEGHRIGTEGIIFRVQGGEAIIDFRTPIGDKHIAFVPVPMRTLKRDFVLAVPRATSRPVKRSARRPRATSQGLQLRARISTEEMLAFVREGFPVAELCELAGLTPEELGAWANEQGLSLHDFVTGEEPARSEEAEEGEKIVPFRRPSEPPTPIRPTPPPAPAARRPRMSPEARLRFLFERGITPGRLRYMYERLGGPKTAAMITEALAGEGVRVSVNQFYALFPLIGMGPAAYGNCLERELPPGFKVRGGPMPGEIASLPQQA